MEIYGRCVGSCPVQTHSFLIVLLQVTHLPLLPLGTLIHLDLWYRLYQLHFSTLERMEILNVDLHFSTIFLWYLSHSHSVVIYVFYAVFTTRFHLPTWRISLAGDIYIASNLNISVCAYYTETGSSLRVMGKCMPLRGLENTMNCTQDLQSLKLPTYTLLPFSTLPFAHRT